MILGATSAIGFVNAQGDPLKVLTINVWSGLDYKGLWKSGEYETADRRGARFRSLVTQVKKLSPDVIFVQEANPVDRYAANLASAFDMEEVHQMVNGGKRIGSLGIPANLKEGLVILARPHLSLKRVDAWKLSGTPGIHTDLISFHHTEAVFALVAKITANQQDIFLVNVHLAAAPRIPEDLNDFRNKILTEYEMNADQFSKAFEKWQRREERRLMEVGKLLGHLEGLTPRTPGIVAGDFNAGPESREMRIFREKGGFTDVLAAPSEDEICTWDPARNTNTSYTIKRTDARGEPRGGFELLASLASNRCMRLDYIFLANTFPEHSAGDGRIVMTTETDGMMASDHFGVLGEVNLSK
jgi:endonuclease/exonuclease/phosphatase family metal-dependent hydrolase